MGRRAFAKLGAYQDQLEEHEMRAAAAQMPWDDAHGGSTTPLDFNSPSALVSHRGYLLSFAEMAPGGSRDVTECPPQLQFAFIRPGAASWELSHAGTGCTPPNWWNATLRDDLALGAPSAAWVDAASQDEHVSTENVVRTTGSSASHMGSSGNGSIGVTPNSSTSAGALLRAPSVLWDPLGRLPDSEGHPAAHLALYYHITFSFASPVARSGAHATSTATTTNATNATNAINATNATNATNTTSAIDRGSCIGRMTARWGGVNASCTPRFERWADDGAPLLCDFDRVAASGAELLGAELGAELGAKESPKNASARHIPAIGVIAASADSGGDALETLPSHPPPQATIVSFKLNVFDAKLIGPHGRGACAFLWASQSCGSLLSRNVCATTWYPYTS